MMILVDTTGALLDVVMENSATMTVVLTVS